MKKRILCTLLALILLVSLVPAAALTASAATLTTSDAAIEVLKQFEGYSKYCEWDNSQWSVGYGTKCDGKNHPANPSNGDEGGHQITEVEANEALRAELATVEAAVNKISGLNQSKFDALVLFSYNCGTAWIGGSGTLKSAVTSGTTGNDFLNAISLWCTSGGDVSDGLLNRRLAEANMYLNGVYSRYAPSNYTYVKYNGNGGTVDQKVQGYNSSSAVAIKASASQSGKTFMGWYTAANGGAWVRSLSSSVAGKTLYAHWQDKTDATYSDVNYTMAASSFTSLQPLSKPSTDGTAHGTKLASTDTVTIVQDYVDANGDKWCRVSGSGWLKVGTLVIEDASSSTSTQTEVTVTNTYINVRKEASASSAKVGTVNYGDKLTITAVKTASNGALWGKFEKGWIALMYTDYDATKNQVKEETDEKGEKDETVSEDAVATAVVSCSTYVNIRKGAGMNNATCGSLTNGTKVTIYEIKAVAGHDWGRISSGWFCLDYAAVTMLDKKTDSDSEDTKDETTSTVEKPIATGKIVCSTSVNIRNGAGVGCKLVTTMSNGATVNIYEIKTVIGHEWGRIGEGKWVCLDYVNYTKIETETDTNTGNGSGSDETTGSDDKTETEETVSNALFTGVVSGATLNVRKEANASSDKLGAYAKGDKVAVSKVVSGVKADGTTAAVWGKVAYTNDKKETVEGWICLTGNVTLDPVNYTVISNSLNVRPGAGTASGNPVDKLAKGTVVAISDLAFVKETTLWGYSEVFGGWMNITSDYMERTTSTSGSTGSTGSTGGSSTGSTGSGSTTSTIVGTAIVNSGVQLKVRSGAGLGYGVVSTLNGGTEVTIYESLLTSGMTWGRTDGGWICLSYVTFNSTGVSGAGEMATIVNTYLGVNVRSSTTTNSALLGKILVNSRVEILEQKTVNGQKWGRVSLGWISMDYVLLDSSVDVDMDAILNGTAGSTGTTGGSTGTTGGSTGTEATALSSYAATVKSATSVYKSAGSVTTVGIDLAKGDAITVYELAEYTADDKTVSYWARVDEGWIPTSCVELKDIKQTYTVTSNTLNVRPGAGTASGNPIGKLAKGDVIVVTELEIVKASIWGYVEEESGWVNTSAQYLTLGKVSTSTGTSNGSTTTTTPSTSTGTTTTTPSTSTGTGSVLYTGTVVRTGTTKLALRSTPSTSGTELGRLADGTSVKIYEVAVAEYMAWGKTDSGWICLTYVDLLPTTEGAVDARVVWQEGLNIRSGAGANNSQVGTYSKCTVVDIFEISGNWGRTADGWVCLDYLLP